MLRITQPLSSPQQIFTPWAAAQEKQQSAHAKTKMQISCAVTTQLIRAVVFTIRIVKFLFYLYPTFQASNLLLWLYSLICVEPRHKPKMLVFSCKGSYSYALVWFSFISNWKMFVTFPDQIKCPFSLLEGSLQVFTAYLCAINWHFSFINKWKIIVTPFHDHTYLN